MIPDYKLSSVSLVDDIVGGRSGHVSNHYDCEDGGIALNDPSEGKDYQVWEGELLNGDIILTSPSTEPEIVYSAYGLTEFSFSFDQNMKPVLSFMQNGECKYRWHDSSIGDYRITIIKDAISPKVFLDDKRITQEASSDIILAYIKSRALYFRLQRDRFEIEYLLKDNVARLFKIGMNRKWRIQFYVMR